MEYPETVKGRGLIHVKLGDTEAIILESQWSEFVEAYREGRGKEFLMAHDIRKSCPRFREFMKELGRLEE